MIIYFFFFLLMVYCLGIVFLEQITFIYLFIFNKFIYLFIYFWLQWVFVAAQGLSLAAVSVLLIAVASLVAEHGL